MATNYPSTVDDGTTLPNPTGTSYQNSPDHAGLHSNAQDAVKALEAKLGTTASTPTLGQLLVGIGLGTSTWSKASPTGVIVGTTDTQTLTSKTLTNPTVNGGTLSNVTVTSDSISGFTTAGSGTVYGLGVISGVISSPNSVGNAALQTNAVQANQLATGAIFLGYAQVTTTVTSSSTAAVQIVGLSVTVTVPAGGRRVKITVNGSDMYSATGAAFITGTLWDGPVGTGTLIGRSQMNGGGTTVQTPLTLMSVVSPSAGSKTYNVGLATSVGANTANIEASPTFPLFILVEAL